MKIIFTRHGESQANLLNEFSNRGLKHPLTQAGRLQAAALANTLRSQNITRIYTSPVLRTLETAVILAEHLEVEYQVVDALREYDVGVFEGRSDAQAWDEFREQFKAWVVHQRWEQHIQGGESFNDVRQRFVPFIERLVQAYAHRAANLVCVAHGGVYWMMLPQVLRNVDLAFIERQGGFPYAISITVELTPGGLVCTDWNGKPVEYPAP